MMEQPDISKAGVLDPTAANQGLVNCTLCHRLSSIDAVRCCRCGSRLNSRHPRSIQLTLALVVTAILFYIPANLFPIMTTELLADKSPSTIMGGVILFIKHGSYFIAAIIFTASVLVPMAKMVAIFWLCYCASNAKTLNHYELTRLYRVTEFVGKWSMVDVYVVAILVALIQVSGLMSIQPGIAASAFATVVILTMISAQQFDIRLIWDKLDRELQWPITKYNKKNCKT